MQMHLKYIHNLNNSTSRQCFEIDSSLLHTLIRPKSTVIQHWHPMFMQRWTNGKMSAGSSSIQCASSVPKLFFFSFPKLNNKQQKDATESWRASYAECVILDLVCIVYFEYEHLRTAYVHPLAEIMLFKWGPVWLFKTLWCQLIISKTCSMFSCKLFLCE